MDIKVIGAKELIAALNAAQKEASHSKLQAIHAKAAKPLIERQKLLAPEGPKGDLIDSIGIVRLPLKRAEFTGEIRGGPRSRRPYKGQHAYIVEFGTRPRTLRGKGKYPAGTFRGVMPAKPFVKPAFIQTQSAVWNGIKTETIKSLDRTLKKYLR